MPPVGGGSAVTCAQQLPQLTRVQLAGLCDTDHRPDARAQASRGRSSSPGRQSPRGFTEAMRWILHAGHSHRVGFGGRAAETSPSSTPMRRISSLWRRDSRPRTGCRVHVVESSIHNEPTLATDWAVPVCPLRPV